MGDEIQVSLEGLPSLEKCATDTGKPILLYLNGAALPGLVPNPRTDPATGTLLFKLKPDEVSRDAWRDLLGSPSKGEDVVPVSVGLEGAYPIPTTATLRLDPVPGWWFFTWLAILFILAAAFLLLAARSNILRAGTSALSAPDAKGPYSLAKAQAAWWFFFVLSAYLFIGIVTGDFASSINATALTLLGIGAGTAVISAAIDSSKETDANKAMQEAALAKSEQDAVVLDAEIRTLNQSLAEAKEKNAKVRKLETDLAVAQKAMPPDRAAVAQLEKDLAAEKVDWDATLEAKLTQQIAERSGRLASLKSEGRKLIGQSEGFLRDIVSDANGASFHRFQIVAWTVVLGVIFVRGVYEILAMPEFSAELLGLQGLSAATYLGLKTQEPITPTKQ